MMSENFTERNIIHVQVDTRPTCRCVFLVEFCHFSHPQQQPQQPPTTTNHQPPTTNELLKHWSPSFHLPFDRYGTTALSSAMGVHLVGSVGGGDMPCCITVLHLGRWPAWPPQGVAQGWAPLNGPEHTILETDIFAPKNGWLEY